MTEDEVVEAMAKEPYEAKQGKGSWDRMGRNERMMRMDFTHHALRIALPWAREQALIEAAAHCIALGPILNTQDCAGRVLALIPTRPSQETTDERREARRHCPHSPSRSRRRHLGSSGSILPGMQHRIGNVIRHGWWRLWRLRLLLGLWARPLEGGLR